MYRVEVQMKRREVPHLYEHITEVRFKNENWLELISEKENILISTYMIEQLSTSEETEE